MKVVIVGGVAGGASAAARLRRLDENAEIVIFERSGYISYANCGLPYYVGGSITDPEELTLQTPGSFKGRFNTRVHVSHEVTAIDPENKRVTVRELESGREFFESYDKLILSPGAKAVIPDVPGVALPGIMSLRTVEDTFRIKDYIGQVSPRSAVVVGGGYIGLEMAENLKELGLEVSIVQRPAQLLKTVDADMASFVHAKLRAEGIRLHLGASLEGFEKNGEDIEVLLSGGVVTRTEGL